MRYELNRALVPESTRAIILDWDDTVVGTIDAKMRQHRYVAEKHFGITLTIEQMKAEWGKPLHQLIESWYQIPPGDEKRYEEVLTTVLSYSSQFLKQPFPLTKEAIETMRDHDYPLGIVTGSPRNDIYHDFEVIGMSDKYFNYFQASDDSTYHKPDPRVFDPTKDWLESIGVASSQVLYMGDSLRDYRAASGAGFMFLGVETAVDDLPAFYQAGALSIRSLGDIIKAKGESWQN